MDRHLDHAEQRPVAALADELRVYAEASGGPGLLCELGKIGGGEEVGGDGGTLGHSRRATRYPRRSVAAPEESEERAADASTGPEPCSPCRGTGKVISNLGEKREELSCPWCEGSGVRIPEHDAQEHFKGETEPASPADAPS